MTEATDTDFNNGLIHFRSEIDNYGKGQNSTPVSYLMRNGSWSHILWSNNTF